MKKLSYILCVSVLTILISCGSNPKKEDIKDTVVNPNWRVLGPGGGGSTFLPTFSYKNEDDFFIKCDMGGAYHTKDGGNTYNQLNYPNGVFSFAYDPNNPQISYVGARDLRKSVDGGKTFKRIFPFKENTVEDIFLGDHGNHNILVNNNSIYPKSGEVNKDAEGYIDWVMVRNIKVDPNNSEFIYFSIDNLFYYTNNGGKTWSKKTFKKYVDFIYTNKTSINETVYVFTEVGINIVDKKTWATTFVGYPEQMKPAFSVTGGITKQSEKTIFYALHNDATDRVHSNVTPTSLWVSNDLGITWKQNKSSIIINENNALPTFSTIATSENDADHVYVVTSSYQEKKTDGKIAHWFGTFKSSDAGKTWQWVWKGGGGSGKYSVRDGIDAQNLTDAWVHKAFGGDYIRLMDAGVAPNDGNTAIITDWYRSMKTTDGGLTWKSVYSTEQEDGTYVSNGLNVTTTYGVHFDPFDPDHIAVSYTDIGYHHSYNGGKSWKRSANGIPANWQNTCYWVVFDPTIKGKVWSAWSGLHDFPRPKITRNSNWKDYAKGGIAVSYDGGVTWKPSVGGDMGLDSPSTSIVIDKKSPENNRTLYATGYGKGVFKSIDDGLTWKLHNNGIEGSLAAFELTMQQDGTLYLVTTPIPNTENGSITDKIFMGALYKSTDGANSWQKISIEDKMQFPNGLAIDSKKKNRLYLAGWSTIYLSDILGRPITNRIGNKLLNSDGGGIIMSDDGGETWRQIFDEKMYVYDVTVDENHKGRIYCNTFNQGAFRSDNYGKTWNKLKGYDFHWGHRVVLDKHDVEKVYLTTFGGSIWHGTPLIE